MRFASGHPPGIGYSQGNLNKKLTICDARHCFLAPARLACNCHTAGGSSQTAHTGSLFGLPLINLQPPYRAGHPLRRPGILRPNRLSLGLRRRLDLVRRTAGQQRRGVRLRQARGPFACDDDLLLAAFYDETQYDALKQAGPIETDYPLMETPLLTLVKELTARSGVTSFHLAKSAR